MQMRMAQHGLATMPAHFVDRQHAGEFLGQFCEQNAVSHATYLGVDIPGLRARRNYVISTYPRAWAARYFTAGYQAIDPAINRGLRSLLPFDWAEPEYSDRRVRDFFDDARSFGVGSLGLSIPIRGPSGERALFSVTADLSLKDWLDFKTEHMSSLMILAYHYHQAVLAMENLAFQPKVTLSHQEVEVLRWAAEGKTLSETGIILSLSPRTVNFYLHNAFEKLGATNKTQAVVRAIRFDLLS